MITRRITWYWLTSNPMAIEPWVSGTPDTPMAFNLVLGVNGVIP